MDMSTFALAPKPSVEDKLKRHCDAIRRNKDVLGAIFQFLSEDPPNASAACEAMGELDTEDQIAVWSVSPTAGGIWETWEREALKLGRLGAAWDTWAARNNRATESR